MESIAQCFDPHNTLAYSYRYYSFLYIISTVATLQLEIIGQLTVKSTLINRFWLGQLPVRSLAHQIYDNVLHD